MDNMHLANYVGEVSVQCDICRPSGAAPHARIAGTSTVSMFSEKLKVDLLFSGDLIALYVMDVSAKNSPLIPVRPKSPQEFRDAICGACMAKCIQMDEGEAWGNEAWADFCSGWGTKLQFWGAARTPGFSSVAMVLREECI